MRQQGARFVTNCRAMAELNTTDALDSLRFDFYRARVHDNWNMDRENNYTEVDFKFRNRLMWERLLPKEIVQIIQIQIMMVVL